jgi:hypothetical protein
MQLDDMVSSWIIIMDFWAHAIWVLKFVTLLLF